MKINTIPKLAHNRRNIVSWNKDEKLCFITDTAGLEVNTQKDSNLKRDIYLPLAAALKNLYPEYTYIVMPIVLGATGLVTSDLVENL